MDFFFLPIRIFFLFPVCGSDYGAPAFKQAEVAFVTHVESLKSTFD